LFEIEKSSVTIESAKLSHRLQIQNPNSKIRNRNMPSGKTHDVVTFLLAAPVLVAAWKLTENIPASAAVAVAFLIGGLMFGPDLDTHSKQYTRWSVFDFCGIRIKRFSSIAHAGRTDSFSALFCASFILWAR
jgi:hypothetical protein